MDKQKQNNVVLSICIPSFNRKESLCKTIQFFIEECEKLPTCYNGSTEIIVRDNASDDGTEACVKSFIENGNNLYYLKNEKNIGATPNHARLLFDSNGEYVWWVADDDELIKGIVKKILDAIYDKDPAVIFLNHGTKFSDGKIDLASGILEEQPIFYQDAKQGLVDIIKNKSVGLILFITSKVIKRRLLLDSLIFIELPNGTFSLHSAFYAAAKGSLYIIKDIHLYNIYGEISWKDRLNLILYHQIPETISRMPEWGYSETQCKEVRDSYFTDDVKKNIRYYKLQEKHPFIYSFVSTLRKIYHTIFRK